MSELKPCPFCGSTNIKTPYGEEGWTCMKCGSNGYWNWNTRPIEDKLQAEIERLKSEMLFVPVFPQWIPVSERLPNRDGFYLILENVNQVAGYYHWCKQFGWNTDGGRIHIQTVTHWMPLPPPPEDE